ncbi:MAG: CRISPR-associated protein (Cas_Cas02710) [Chloroflexi bacterium ADurb.Bin360]|nr:MAG: CRISPR-associated protein (Cas_Cas02710) [Chloroflexi bacterium ADurb.Bin360]
MENLLVLTVGGSCAPVITAIRDYKPVFVCFVVSGGEKGSRVTVEGPGNPCGDSRTTKCAECGKNVPLGNPTGPNILTQTGLSEGKYKILEFTEPDDLASCYTQLRSVLAQLRIEYRECRALADYTGGTKTMTAALTLAALENGYELSLVKGARADLVKVRNGTEIAALVNIGEVRARQKIGPVAVFDPQHLAEGIPGLLKRATFSINMLMPQPPKFCRILCALPHSPQNCNVKLVNG